MNIYTISSPIRVRYLLAIAGEALKHSQQLSQSEPVECSYGFYGDLTKRNSTIHGLEKAGFIEITFHGNAYSSLKLTPKGWTKVAEIMCMLIDQDIAR